MGFHDLLAHWGIALVFAATLVEQAGLPLPAAPCWMSQYSRCSPLSTK